jgi:hypothetical protein
VIIPHRNRRRGSRQQRLAGVITAAVAAMVAVLAQSAGWRSGHTRSLLPATAWIPIGFAVVLAVVVALVVRARTSDAAERDDTSTKDESEGETPRVMIVLPLALAVAALLAGLYFLVAPRTAKAQRQPATTTGAPSWVSDSIHLDTPTGRIEGTIVVPAAKVAAPVMLIIAGSGPTDRNGNSPLLPGANNNLKQIAESLATRGIASLRYDKRGIAASRAAGPAEADLRFDHYVDDAAAWIKLLRADPRFTTITVVGHSEGSLIGMIAAQRASADGFVSIAGAGRPAGVVLREQLTAAPMPPEMRESALRGIAALESGHTADSTPPALAALFRPSVQPYLISWLRYRPAEELGRLGVPTLIVQGTTDVQVKVTDAEALKAGQPRAQLLIVEGMNHVLKHETAMDMTAQMKSYGDPSLPVVPELLRAIETLVRSTRKR